jgi:hypothetical protein
VLEFGEELLDWVQVGGIFRQEEGPGVGAPDGRSHGLGLVGAEVVHDYQIARPQRRGEDLFDIDQEPLAVDRAVDQPGRLDPIVAQGRQEGHRVPVPEWRLAWQALTTRRPAAQRRHVGLGPGLINEDQPRRVDARPVFQPLRAPSRDIGAVPFAGDQRLFL